MRLGYESEPGCWDWTNADAGLAAMRTAGMNWQYFPHFHWPPEWYRRSDKFVPSIGLRSKRRLAAMSIWSPDAVRWFDHGYAALANHYGHATNNLYANCVEERTLKALAAWIKKGGVLVWWGKEVPQTVEGGTKLSSTLLGLTPRSTWQAGGALEIQNTDFLRHMNAHVGNRAGATGSDLHRGAVLLGAVERRPAIWAVPNRQGWVIAAADLDRASFNELVRDVAYNLSKLDAAKADAPEVDMNYDGVYTTLLANGEVVFHNFNSEARTNRADGATVVLPPKSLRSVLRIPANPP